MLISDDRRIVDRDGHIMVVAASRLPDDWMVKVVAGFKIAIDCLKAKLAFSPEKDRHGPFKCVTYSISFEGGQQVICKSHRPNQC